MFMEVCNRWKISRLNIMVKISLECSLNCGGEGNRCLKTKIPNLPEICACSDGTFSNLTCPEMEENKENVTAINIHGGTKIFFREEFHKFLFYWIARRLVAVCEHSFCGTDGVCIIIDSTFGCICPDGGIADRCSAGVNTGLSKSIDRRERNEKMKKLV